MGERRLLFHYPSIPAKFGLCVTPTPSIGGDVVTASAVPDCFLKREESDLKYHRPSSLRRHTISLTRDIVESVRETGSAAVILPKTIMNVLSSRACRSELRYTFGKTNHGGPTRNLHLLHTFEIQLWETIVTLLHFHCKILLTRNNKIAIHFQRQSNL